MTVVAILRAVPIATNAESMNPEGVTHFEMYARDALHPLPGCELTDVPVRVDHVKEASVGRVTGLRVDTCVGGPSGTWQYVHVAIDDPPGWLRVGTPVSISRACYQSRTPWDADWLLVQRAILTEISLLSPGHEPAHPAACVEWVGKREPAAAAPTSDAAAGEARQDPPAVLRRSASDREELDELVRRLAWVEKRTGRPAHFEEILGNMKSELGYGGMDREWARLVARRSR